MMTKFAYNSKTPIAMSQFFAFERNISVSINSVNKISKNSSVTMPTYRTVNSKKMIRFNEFESNLGKLCSLLDISDHSEDEKN